MDQAKITLSAVEIELVQNADVILTKRRIIDKVCGLFGDISSHLQTYMLENPDLLPPEVYINAPKIAKGENYRGLPYVMLDFPRFFGKEAIFAIRIFFWWGNYFSCTLHTRGEFLPTLLNVKVHESLIGSDCFMSFDGDEWNHDVQAGNYVIAGDDLMNRLNDRSFLKITRTFPLNRWEQAGGQITECAKSWLELFMTRSADHAPSL